MYGDPMMIGYAKVLRGAALVNGVKGVEGDAKMSVSVLDAG